MLCVVYLSKSSAQLLHPDLNPDDFPTCNFECLYIYFWKQRCERPVFQRFQFWGFWFWLFCKCFLHLFLPPLFCVAFLPSSALPFNLEKKTNTKKSGKWGASSSHSSIFFTVSAKIYQFAQPCPLQSLPIQLFHGLPDLSWVLDEFEYTDAHSTGQTSMCRKTVSSDNLLIFLKHLQHEGRWTTVLFAISKKQFPRALQCNFLVMSAPWHEIQ